MIPNHLHPDQVGPREEKIYTYAALLGPESAEQDCVHPNGIHGLGGYSEAAAQLKWVDSEALSLLSENNSIILVHIINPFGWANGTRRNEDLIDLKGALMENSSIKALIGVNFNNF